MSLVVGPAAIPSSDALYIVRSQTDVMRLDRDREFVPDSGLGYLAEPFL
jgi:hypothetical protein